MRGLAEYVMKGRTEAAIAAVFAIGTVLFAWIGAAVIALVTLRKGATLGSQVLLWAMLPAVVWSVWGDPGPLATLLGVAWGAMVLRATESWAWVLVAAVVSGLLSGVVLLTLSHAYIEEILRLYAEFMAVLVSQQNGAEGPALVAPVVTAPQVAGLLGLNNAFTVVLCLILARWWQSMLYNPGGFRAEFHRLRLPPKITVGLLLLGVLMSSLGADFQYWALIFSMPFIFAGFALIHGLAAQKNIDANWLAMFYFCWLLLAPVKVLLIVLVVVDSWMGFRERLAKS